MYALKRRFASDLQLERNTVMLGEHYNQVLNSINGTLVQHSKTEHLTLMQQRVEMIEQLHKWVCDLGEFRRSSRGLYTVLERGLLNHVACFEDWDDPRIVELCDRLTNLGIEEILLAISPELISERWRLRYTRMNVMFSEHEISDLTAETLRQQERMFMVIKRLPLPYRVLNTDAMDWDAYATEILGPNEQR